MLTAIATAIGFAGTLCLALSFQCREERRLFWMQMLSGLLFVLHYGLLGDYTGMAMDGMCFIRALMMISGNRFLTSKFMAGLLCGVIVLLCVLTWDGIFSLFPTIALLTSTVFLFIGDGKKIRIAQFFVTSPAWMTYNIHVMSVPGILCESLDMLSVLVYAIRMKRTKRIAE